MLEARALTFVRQGRGLLAPVSCRTLCGEITAIVGPNGAGKSTLLGLLSGWLRPGGGGAFINGRMIADMTPRELALCRAVVEQATVCPQGLTVGDVVGMGAYRGAPSPLAVAHALRLCQSTALAGRQMADLSGGERQRVHLARALCQLLSAPAPGRHLLLDEATSALDFGMADALFGEIRTLARQEGIGVTAVLHDINLALRHADRVLLLDGGRAVAFGPVREVMDRERLEALYDVRLAELISPDRRQRAFVPLSRHQGKE
ncbi:ATP-binding cassette domain-containing protein [Paludibacterium yongneupense]|uniref:ATP-binding cassette domain-containing protein n=1 Tax=Paludibacterium yongneupense TaxID=400061 RepID=UPI0003F4FBE8|nr:ATP-binding cassette domain-containing protein [Paludibacterium yongneupense]